MDRRTLPELWPVRYPSSGRRSPALNVQRPNLGRLAPATKANGEARKRIPIKREQITVLFADLKGSMELLSERDPEEARKILAPVLDHMMGRV